MTYKCSTCEKIIIFPCVVIYNPFNLYADFLQKMLKRNIIVYINAVVVQLDFCQCNKRLGMHAKCMLYCLIGLGNPVIKWVLIKVSSSPRTKKLLCVEKGFIPKKETFWWQSLFKLQVLLKLGMPPSKNIIHTTVMGCCSSDKSCTKITAGNKKIMRAPFQRKESWSLKTSFFYGQLVLKQNPLTARTRSSGIPPHWSENSFDSSSSQSESLEGKPY